MAKCKYPNEVCANMTVLNGDTYCDSVPCSLKDDLPKQTNADRIRNMSDEELAEFFDKMLNQDRLDGESIGCFDCIYYKTHHQDESRPDYACKDCEFKNGLLEWLQAEVEE